jgi:cytidylate kinase
MNAKISMHVENFRDAMPRLKEAFLHSGYSSQISVDGHSGSGKSTFAKLICAELDGGYLELDECLSANRVMGLKYVEMIDYTKLMMRMTALAATNKLIVLEGLCLGWIVPQFVHNSFRVYMERNVTLSEVSENRRRTKFGTSRYHEECDPAAAAHFIISSPGI